MPIWNDWWREAVIASVLKKNRMIITKVNFNFLAILSSTILSESRQDAVD